MKMLLVWIILFFLMELISAEVFVVSNSAKPSGTRFYPQHQFKEAYCITDDLDSALVWNHHLEWQFSNFENSDESFKTYLLPRNQTFVYPASDSLNCWMNYTSECSRHWIGYGNWKFKSSIESPTAPVTDTRWEDFDELKLNHLFRPVDVLLGSGSLAVSIRGSSDAHFAICEGKNVIDSFCFFIILGGWKNTRSVIRKCEKGLPESADTYPVGECARILVEHGGQVLSSTEWKHFVLKWNFENQISIKVFDTSSMLLNYQAPKNRSYFAGERALNGHRYFIHARTSGHMLLKPHVYGYSLATETQSKLMSPPIMSPNKYLCVDMSVSLCEKCTMTIDYIDHKETIKAGGIAQNKGLRNIFDLPVWQSIRVNKTLAIKNQTMVQPVKLVINTFLTDTEAINPYWAISNVRRCNDDVLKIAQVKTNQDSTKYDYFWPNVTCQKMSANGDSTVIDVNNIVPTTKSSFLRPLCPEGIIGPSCSTNCSLLFWEHPDCQQLLACDKSGCSCAPGFMMSTCDKHCSASMYGYECEKTCGNCAQNLCKPSTGECTYGCANTDRYYFLPPYCKTGIGPPPAPMIDILQFTWVKVSLQVRSEYKAIPTNVTFEVWTNSGVRIFESDTISVNRSTTHIDAEVENLNPGTHYTVIGVVHAGRRLFRGQWTNFTTLCTESLPLNFDITSNETSIVVNNLVVVNDSCPYTWYRVQLLKDKDMLIDYSSSFPITFSELEPYTTYRVIVRSENSSVIIDKYIITLEGAPDQVTNSQCVSNYPNNVTVTWASPSKPRGKIINYTLEIQPISSLGCNNYNLTSYNTTISRQLRQTTITNVSEDTNKYTFSGLRPYTVYFVSIYASTLRHRGARTSAKCTTKPTEMPTEIVTDVHLTTDNIIPRVAAVLRWNIPSDCSLIEGPMRAFNFYYRKLENLDYKKITALNNNSYALEKNLFNGAETYESRLHILRDIGGMENKTAFAIFKITLPAREPPPVRNLEIVEVDVYNGTVTLRWEPPLPPIHGQLDAYSIIYCSIETQCDDARSIVVKSDVFCNLWDTDIGMRLHEKILCQTIPYSKGYNYIIIKVQARNKNVKKLSQPEFIQIINSESTPTEPSSLSTEIINPQNASVKVSWAHPWKTGGRLEEFSVVAQVIESNLTFVPWKTKNYSLKIGNSTYKPQYDLILNLLPSTTFSISVRGVTVGKIDGEVKTIKITLPTFVNVSTVDLKPRVNHNLIIRIRIPQVANNVVNSSMVIIVEGPRYCDEGPSNNEDIDMYLNTQTSSYYKVAWKAATFTVPEAQANKEFEIGDGLIYEGSKNYALCPMESYIVNLIISDGTNIQLTRSHESLGRNILKSIKTNAIQIGEKPQNYAVWLIPLLFIVLVVIILFAVLHRKRLTKHFYNKSKVCQQENMPLSNDFTKKKSLDEGDAISTIKETKDFPNNLFVNDGPKPEFLMPVKLKDFEKYFESACKSGALLKEYSTIQRGVIKACTYGSQTETKPKNRYANLYPYDESRVILEKLPDDPYSDYINANFIKGYGEREKAYIATQGPKPHTVIDFWRMIWQEKVQIICMMANLSENGKTKCEQYWPSAVGKKVLYDTISVQFTSEEMHMDYTYRTFNVKRNEETRVVEHLHYTSWPDHGVPSNPGSIVSFLKEVHRHSPVPRKRDDPPIVVHCSAGVGRTGTLIVLDKCLCRAFSEQVIDVYADVLSVREQRMNMVDNTEQYLLVHLVLVEYFNSENTCFNCDKTLPERIAKAKRNASDQYQRILNTSWWNEILGSPPLPEKSLSNINRAKHRFPESAAGNINRLYLKRSVVNDEDSDYIAATNVRGIFKSRNYITTQLPLPSTSADFWRMLSEHNVELVLVLQLPDLSDPSYCELVPESQGFGNTKYLKVILQKSNTTSAECYTTEEVLIIDSSEQPIKDQTVTIISYKNWSDISLPPATDIVKIWHLLEKNSKKEKSPIVIVCRDGVTASGLWLASSILLNRMKIDKECDVYQAVRTIRRCRKNFLYKSEYLAYLYDVALAWSNENCENVD